MDDLHYNLAPLRGPEGCARTPAMMPPRRRLLAGDTRDTSAELAELQNRKRQQAERDDFDGAKVTHGEIQRLQAEMTDLQKKATQQRVSSMAVPSSQSSAVRRSRRIQSTAGVRGPRSSRRHSSIATISLKKNNKKKGTPKEPAPRRRLRRKSSLS